jgi:hypothetical protein
VISGFRRDVNEICDLLGYYAPSSSNPLSTFREKVGVPSSRVKKMGPISCPETSVKDYHSTVHNIPEDRRSQGRARFRITVSSTGATTCIIRFNITFPLSTLILWFLMKISDHYPKRLKLICRRICNVEALLFQ